MTWSFEEQGENGTFAFSGYKRLHNATAALAHAVPAPLLNESGFGSWVQTYVAPRIVQTLSQLAPAFPGPHATEEEFDNFWHTTISAAGSISIIGLVLAIALSCFLCCCHPRPRTNRAGGPFLGPVCASGCLTAVCLVFGCYRCYVAGASGFGIVSLELLNAEEDVDYLATSANTLDTCGVSIQENLRSMQSFCSSWTWKGTVEPTTNMLIYDVGKFLNYTSTYRQIVEDLPRLLRRARGQSDDITKWTSASLITPTVLAISAIIFILLAVCWAECRGHASIQRADWRFSMPCIGCTCVGPLIFMLGLVSTLQISLGIATSSACAGTTGGGIDETVLAYAGANLGNTSAPFNLTRYYIQGVGENTAAAVLKQGMFNLEQVSNGIGAIKFAMYCTSSGHTYNTNNLTWFTAEATNSVDGCIREVRAQNLYPFYVNIVHKLLCGTTVEGIFWLVSLQLVLGFVCLPLLTVASSMFLDSMAVVRGDMYEYHHAELLEDAEMHGYNEPMD